MSFKPGEKVLCVNPIPKLRKDQIYTIREAFMPVYRDNMSIPGIELEEIKGWFGADRFIALKEYKDVCDALGGEFASLHLRCSIVETDPNQDMIDEDKKHAKEFESIIRKREYERRKKALKDPIIEEYWDGEHLSNAIEKTVSGAVQPQAMWSIHGT